LGFGRSVRHFPRGPGDREERGDEDENLGGAGSLERGQPNSRFFETLEYRVTNPEGDLPEVPERRPIGGARGTCASTWFELRSRGFRPHRRREAHGQRTPIRPRPGRGEPQGGRSPGEPEYPRPAEMRSRDSNATRGSNPWSEAAPDRRPDRGGDHNGPSVIRDARDLEGGTRRPPGHAPKPKGDGAGPGPGETRSAERQ